MKIDNSYKVRTVCDENVVIRQGKAQADMTTVISLNKTAVELWHEFEDKEFTNADVEKYLIGKYGIDQELAAKDAEKWAAALKNCNIIK